MDMIEPDLYARLKTDALTMAMQSINGLNNNNKSYDLILDVGCGDGGITKLLAKHLRHKLVVGIDVVDDMISYARNHSTDDNNDNTIEYVLQDMDIDWLRMCPRIRQLESKVDLIFSNFVLEYMANKWLVMDTFGHLLATGGVFHANIFILPDLNKKLPENGQKKWWYQSREKQLDDWRQSLTDNQFLIKQFETIDVCWPTDRQKMIDYMPIIISKFRSFFQSMDDFNAELNDHLWDTVFDSTVNPTDSEPNPRAWKQFLADNTITEVNRYPQLLRVTAVKYN